MYLTLEEINIIENKINNMIKELISIEVQNIFLEELRKMNKKNQVKLDAISYNNNWILLFLVEELMWEIKNFKIIKDKSYGKCIRRFEVECNF